MFKFFSIFSVLSFLQIKKPKEINPWAFSYWDIFVRHPIGLNQGIDERIIMLLKLNIVFIITVNVRDSFDT